MKRRFPATIVPLILATLAGPAAEIPDQQQPLLSGSSSLHADYSIGQSFIPDSREIRCIEIHLRTQKTPVSTAPVTLSVRTAFHGAIMGSATVPAGAIGQRGGWVAFSFNPPLRVRPGSRYLFRLDTPAAPDDRLVTPAVSDLFDDPYPAGTMLSSWRGAPPRILANQDLAFKIYGAGCKAAPSPAVPRAFLNVDYSDNFIYAGRHNFGSRNPREEIAETIRLARENGFDAVNWRVSFMGEALYPSQVIDIIGQYGSRGYGWVNRDDCMAALVRAVRTVDPLATATEEAHRAGLKIYAWVTINDFGISEERLEKFFRLHPYYQWHTRDGKKFLSGTPCFAIPEVRQYLLRQLRELMAYGVDGLFVSTRGHTTAFRRPTLLEYGFNAPIIEAYRKRYGIDLRLAFDAERDGDRLIRLRAELDNALYRELDELRRREFPHLRIMADLSQYPQNWPEWIRNHWIDELAVNTVAGSEGALPTGREYRDLGLFYRRRIRRHGTGVEPVLWLQVYSYRLRYQHMREEIADDLRGIRASGVFGLIFHEHCAALAEPENFWPYLSRELLKKP